MNVAAQPIELGDSSGAPLATGLGECCGKLRAPVESISALARFAFDEHAAQCEALGLGKGLQRLLLCLKAKARAALLRRADPGVTNQLLVGHCIPPLPYKKHTTVYILYKRRSRIAAV